MEKYTDTSGNPIFPPQGPKPSKQRSTPPTGWSEADNDKDKSTADDSHDDIDTIGCLQVENQVLDIGSEDLDSIDFGNYDSSIGLVVMEPAAQLHLPSLNYQDLSGKPAAENITAFGPVPQYLRQIKQAAIMDGLALLLADIYGDRSNQPFTLFDIFHRLGVDSLVVSALARTQGQPIANKLLERLSHRLALTAEGHKQFEILKMHYGLNGDKRRTVTELSLVTCLPVKDVKHLIMMMRCRLESDQIKQFVESTVKLLIADFARSSLFREIVSSESNRSPEALLRQPDLYSSIKEFEVLADSLVDNLDRQPTVNICGQAGSGKTSLALKVAARLLQKGKRVLYVTHSRFFAQHVQSLTKFFPGDLTVLTFHALCHLYAREAGVPIPAYRNNKVFTELFPELLIEAIHILRENAFDAIVVDEGHALLPNFWRALKFCLKDLQQGAFLYFYDPIAMSLGKNKAAPFALRTINLDKILRPHFNLVAIKGGLELYEAISKEEAGQAVSRALSDLIDQGIAPDQIAILQADSLPKISNHKLQLPRGIKLAASPTDRPRHILYTSLSSFRALSKKVVIVILEKTVEDLPDWKLKYLSYCAFSRAGEKLILIGNLTSIARVLPDGVKIINPEAFDPQLRRQ